ncbi:Acetyltransferase involved in cellulose biosynthesis, CelD/BcsL family [Friedmanniella luteola]|uniref:Acetyltransferase involved in cellulose biosynthesis, CelD/BcsL family n=1 Tax=Friedmanniella luteola TaxID=546871 RepID=A0A1H1PZQ0_9ACTN|nr:GNAT family N-acetyltransferase [Friedmanniella luteola]SDS16467.1 Acetyltransferase involved in cellulose biosynthesis, CelD/BcsL family [Friedmanniella luteola]
MSQPATAALGLETEVVRDARAFGLLAQEWDRLYGSAPRATPFQTHAWLVAWWRAYGEPGRLRVVLVRSQGRLVAAAPLHLVNRGPVRVLAPLGGAISDFTDVLVEEARGRDEASAYLSGLVDALDAVAGWDVLDLPEVRGGAAAELLAGLWPGRVRRQESSACMELPVTDFSELLLTLPTKRAREVRRVLRRSDELGLVVADVPSPEVAEAVPRLLQLHALQWEGRGGNPEHQRPRFAQHLAEALTVMVDQGQAAVVRYQLDGQELAGQVVLVGHDLIGGYLLGVAPELYRRMDFSTYVVRADLERARGRGCSTYSMLRGRESYKERWHAVAAVNSRLLLVRPSAPRGLAYALGVRSRARLVVAAGEHAPWLVEARQRYRRRAADRASGRGGPGPGTSGSGTPGSVLAAGVDGPRPP